MSSLVPCRDCGRHAKLEEASCPFCGGTLPRTVRRPRVVRKITRALIFFGGATLAACSTPETAPEAEPSAIIDLTPMVPVANQPAPSEPGALPPLEPIAVVAESPEQARAERADAERRKRRLQIRGTNQQVQQVQVQQVPPPPPPCCMPYGAPPADFDLV